MLSLKPLLKELEDGHLPFISLQYTDNDGVQHLVAAVYLGKVDTLNTEKLKSMVSISCDPFFLGLHNSKYGSFVSSTGHCLMLTSSCSGPR